jgi:hypothetical protein
MFRTLATTSAERDTLLRLHPAELAVLLETAWNQRRRHAAGSPPATPDLGHPDNRSAIPGLGLPVPKVVETPPGGTPQDRITPFLTKLGSLSTPPVNGGPIQGVVWPHLIYAYMIENTGIYEVFRRVLHEFLHGERLGVPTAAAQHWLRITEALFYRDPLPLSIIDITSHVRPDLRATRRNAYWRMFGMDLNHGGEGGQPYPYVKAETHNNEFVTTLEELLREVWVAITNVGNQSGVNPTDRGKIETLVAALHNMLVSRRVYGNLSREEFVAVTTMSWFHVSMQADLPIIQSLRAEAASPEQRLFKVAERVGLPAHGLSKSYFDLADPLSQVLVQIEEDPVAIVPGLLVQGDLQTAMSGIITHWSIVTGRDMKARKVAAS